MSKRDYYEVLGVSKEAGEEELKKAFRKLAVQHHPDRNPGDKQSEETFKELNEAYQILSDPEKRRAYDRFGHAGVGAGGGGFSGGFPGGFSDVFEDILGDIFGASGRSSQDVGVDLRYNLELSFEEAAFGVEKKISFEREASCATCSGSGAKPGTRPKACKTCRGAGQVRFNQGFFTMTRTCPACGGRGQVFDAHCPDCRGRGSRKQPVSITVPVPPGIDTGQRIRLRGQGETSGGGGAPGDLYVVVSVLDHPLFRREGEHVLLDFPITFVQAAIGAEVEVPTLGGTSPLRVPAGMQSGEILRLKGRGIRRLNGSGSGDQLVRILVETPARLNSRQKQLLQEFEQVSEGTSQPGVTRFVEKVRELFKR